MATSHSTPGTPLVRATIPFVVLLGIWYAVELFFDPGRTTLASPQAVLFEVGELIREGTLPSAIGESLGRLLPATAVAVVAGGPIGMLIGLCPNAGRAMEPTLRFFNAVSSVAWLPVLITWVGFGQLTIILIVIYTALFPMIFSTSLAVTSVPRTYVEGVRTLGAGPLRRLWGVYLPGAVPGILSGLRSGVAYGWRALIAGEFVVGGGGLGMLVLEARTAGLVERVMAGMIVMALLWLVIDRLILKAIEEHFTTRWGLAL